MDDWCVALLKSLACAEMTLQVAGCTEKIFKKIYLDLNFSIYKIDVDNCLRSRLKDKSEDNCWSFHVFQNGKFAHLDAGRTRAGGEPVPYK